MKNKTLLSIAWPALALALSFTPAYGQAVHGTLVGTITDASHAVVPGAKITITETNTGRSRSVETNPDGYYVFSNLEPGVFRVVVEQAGFRKAVRDNVDLLVNSTVRVDLELQTGSVTETVTVTAEAPLLQTDRSDTNVKIEETQLANIPISTPGGRNFQAMLNFVPGTTPAFRPHSEFFNAQASLATQANGQSRLANNLQFEGVDNNERTGLLQVLIPPLESLQTVDISTSNFEAELGRATGAVTNIIMKSGSNRFHAQGYWYNRVSALSARPFYDAARSHFVYNYLGAQVGGPIRKNKTFFFFDFLRQTDHRYSGDRYTLPTAAQRAGDFSAYSPTIFDPLTAGPDGTGKRAFAGNMIPQARLQANPIAQKILALVPLPNLPGLNQNFFELIPFVRNTNQYDMKFDHNQTDKDRISVRYSHSTPVTYDGPAFGLAGGPHGGGFQGTGTQATHNGAINYTRVFSPRLISELRFGVSRYRNDSQQVDYGSSASTALGVPGVNTGDAFVSGLVGIDIGGYSSPLVGYSASLPWVRAETNIDLVNSWTKTMSKHTVKWGFDLRRLRDELLQAQTFSPRGRYSYGTNQTSNPGQSTSMANNFASFLLDVPDSGGRDLPIIFPTFRAWQLFLYAQDKWQVTQKLTLDFGLRWEFYPPAVSSHPVAGFSNYDPSNNTLVLTGLGGNPQNMGLHSNHKDFAPRFSIAYRWNEKTVFRAGFGISYSPFPDNQYGWNNFPITQNNPFLKDFTYGPALLRAGGPIAQLATGFPAPQVAVLPSNGIITNPANSTYNVINKNFREPYVESWNFAVQRALPHNFSIDVAYVANHGVDQPAVQNLNASTTLGGDVASQPLNVLFKRTADTNLRYVGHSSNYNSMQVKINRRFSNGLQVNTSYTYGKALGFQSEDAGLTYYINGQRNWRRLDFDRKSALVLGYVWEVPFGKGKRWINSNPVASAVLGGWQLNGSLDIRTGTPLNFGGTTGVLKAPGNGNSLNYFGPGGINILKGTGRDASWFQGTKCNFDPTKGALVTSTCFAQPGTEVISGPVPFEFGNLGPNVISGPGSWNMNLSVFRSFKVTERLSLQLRGESFSVLNTPIWNNPDTGIGNATFGYITGAGGNRTMQLGLKVLW